MPGPGLGTSLPLWDASAPSCSSRLTCAGRITRGHPAGSFCWNRSTWDSNLEKEEEVHIQPWSVKASRPERRNKNIYIYVSGTFPLVYLHISLGLLHGRKDIVTVLAACD